MKPNDALNIAINMTKAGLSVVPPAEDGTKKPSGTWLQYQKRIAGEAQLRAWYTVGKLQGFGIVCGQVSGNLECIDFDDMGLYEQALNLAAQDPGLGYIVNKIEAGYKETTPKGIHWLYRCEEIDRNKKLARIKKDGKYYAIETRGEGGYVITAPTSSSAINPGGAYQVQSGSVETIATISKEERDKLHHAMRSLDAEHGTRTVFKAVTIPEAGAQNKNRPGDDYNDRTTWGEVLEPAGWSVFGQRGDVVDWCKPGSNLDHAHATTGYGGSDIFYCFSSAAPPFEPEQSYSKFAVFAMLHHNGDFEEASCALRDLGYGSQGPSDLPAYQKPKWNDTFIEKVILNKSKRQEVAELGMEAAYGFDCLKKMDIPPINKWVEWMPEGLIVFAGAPKLGKSWFCLELCACAIADNKRRVLGEFDTTMPEKMEVLYLALEDTPRRMKERGTEVLRPPLRFNEHVPTANHHRFKVRHDWPKMDRSGLDQLHQWFADNPSCKLVIIDTLQKIKPISRKGANAYEADYDALANIKKIADHHSATIIVVTHLNKSSISADPMERITGSSGVTGAADAIWMLKRPRGKEEGAYAEFHVTGRDIEDQTYSLRFRDGRWRFGQELVDFQTTQNQQYVVEALEEIGENGAKPGDVKKWLLDRNLPVPGSFYHILRQLLENGFATKDRNGKYRLKQKKDKT